MAEADPRAPVLVAGFPSRDNFGDRIIAGCAAYLVKQAGFPARLLDLKATSRMFNGVCWRACRRGARLFLGRWPQLQADVLAWVTDRLYRSDYTAAVQGAERLVVAGGALIRYQADGLDLALRLLLEVCREQGVQVLLNSVGVEGGPPRSPRSTALRAALRNGAVVAATVRDGLETLHDGYLGGTGIPVAKVPDVAWWADQAYGVFRQPSNLIGIGPLRPTALAEIGKPVPVEVQRRFWARVARELLARGRAVEFFCNGPASDIAFARSVLAGDPVLRRLTLRIPTDEVELMGRLSSYDRILSGRLHACIPAWSLGIPAMGVVWSPKTPAFFEQIGHPERAVTFAEVAAADPGPVVDRLLAAEITSQDRAWAQEQRLQTKAWLEAFLNGAPFPNG